MNFKRLTEILPLFGVFLILLGYLKLYIYYDNWNIPIIDYLDITEITLLFLSDVHIIIAFIAIYLFPLVIGLAVIKYIEEREKKKAAKRLENNDTTTVKSTSEVVEEVADTIFNHAKFYFMLLCLAVAVVFICLFFAYNKIWQLYFATFTFMQFALIFTEYLFDNDEKLSIQITFIVSAIAFSVFVSHYDICKTEMNTANFKTSIITSDTTFHTSTDLLYIGKTSNYVFMYDVANKTSKTIKTENLKEINITK